MGLLVVAVGLEEGTFEAGEAGPDVFLYGYVYECVCVCWWVDGWVMEGQREERGGG